MIKPKISYVVLNWNGLTDTLLCLDSIRNQSDKSFEIIVVDNGSVKEQKEILRKIEDIILIDLDKNEGFTGGQIAAYQEAKGEYIALINNDAVISPDWGSIGIHELKSNNNIGAIGGRAYDWNNENKVFDSKNKFSSYQVVNLRTGHCPTLRTGESEVSVGSISGAAVLIRKSAIDKVGYFDNRFFAYYEETDLFARFKRAGYKIIYTPKMSAWHKVGQSTKKIPEFYLYQMHRNRFIFAFKNLDNNAFLLFAYSYFVNEWLITLIVSLVKRGKITSEQKMLIKAGWWNIMNIIMTIVGRIKTQKLGKTYNKLLDKDAQEDITIIIPCYNYENYVSEAILSAAEQTHPPSIITVINDGSTDESIKVITNTVDSLSKKYLNISFKVIDQKNIGIINTKNEALFKVNTQWIVFLDADDILDKKYLEKCMAMQKIKNSDVVYTDMLMFGAVNVTQKSLDYNKYRIRSVNFINNSALYRVNVLKQTGGYNKKFDIGFEDWEINLNLTKFTSRFSHIHEPLLNYRRHSGASRDNNAQQKIETVVKMLEKIHPDLFNIRFYVWLETSRAYTGLKQVVRYPFLVVRHVYYHSIMSLDKSSRNNNTLKIALKKLRSLKHKV